MPEPAELPEPLAGYFVAANAHDVDRTVGFFAADGVVKDEGREHRGHGAIRAWIEGTNAKYRPGFKPGTVAGPDDRPVVAVVVSGAFKGSPVTLRYAFRIKDRRITHLEIT